MVWAERLQVKFIGGWIVGTETAVGISEAESGWYVHL